MAFGWKSGWNLSKTLFEPRSILDGKLVWMGGWMVKNACGWKLDEPRSALDEQLLDGMHWMENWMNPVPLWMNNFWMECIEWSVG